MKLLFFLTALFLCVSFSSCSKKSTPQPVLTTHVLKITATVNINYQAGVNIKKSGESAQTNVDDKMLAAGAAYEFTTAPLNTGDQAFFSFYIPDIRSSGKVTYSIKDNGVEKTAETNRDFNNLSIQYIVK